MKAQSLFWIFCILLSYSCQAEKDEFDNRTYVTDTFILVDCHEGVYKFVQEDNLYTIGVVEGLLDIPINFTCFDSEESQNYYSVELKLTGIQNGSMTTKYQKYTGESDYFLVKRSSTYNEIACSVYRSPFYNDYIYYVIY